MAAVSHYINIDAAPAFFLWQLTSLISLKRRVLIHRAIKTRH